MKRKKIELTSNISYNPKEILPNNADPGSSGSISTSLRFNFFSKSMRFSKNSKNGFQVGIYVIPLSVSKGIGITKNVLPSDTQGASNELYSNWGMVGIVITPLRRKNN
jgi:hypothetical protein